MKPEMEVPMSLAADLPAASAAPDLPARFDPPEPYGSIITMVAKARENALNTWPRVTYEELTVRYTSLFFDTVYLSDPAGIEQVLLRNAENYGKAPIQQRILKPGLGNGLLTAEGQDWERQRRIARPAFDASALHGLIPGMVRAVETRATSMVGTNAPRDVHADMMALTLDILFDTLFSRIEVDRAATLELVTEFIETTTQIDLIDIYGLPDWIPRAKTRRLRPVVRALRETVAGAIAARKADPDPPHDLLTLMMQARDEATGEGLSDRELLDNAITFFGAGHETTAQALTWTLYLLAKYPWAEEKCLAEIDAVVGSDPFEASHISQLRYLRQVLEESMRLYPPAPMFDRIALGPDEIGDETIRKGTVVLISPYVLHRHKLLWDEPDRFDPERFTQEAKRARPRCQYIPFSFGRRSCIGMSFAMMEAITALAILVPRFRFRREAQPEPELECKITLRPKGGMPMTVTPR
jgi:cytochrome P450